MSDPNVIGILNSLPSGLMVFRGDTILFANAPLYARLGYPAGNLTHLGKLVAAPYLEQLALPSHLPLNLELPLRHADGSPQGVKLTISASEWEGQPAYLGMVQDPKNDATPFQDRLKDLHAIIFELSQAATIDELCYQAVRLGRSRLHFDRLALWLVADEPAFVRGMFSTDEHGTIRDERHQRLPFKLFDVPTVSLGGSEHVRDMRLYFDENVPLYDAMNNVVGQGWAAMSYLQDGERVIGFLSTDNLLLQAPLEPYQLELLVLYASSLAHLYLRKRMESALLEGERAKAALQKEQALNMMKNSLMMRISHEFRTPLTVILNSTELLEHYRQRLTPEKEGKHFQLIKQQVDRLTMLLDDIVMTARGMFDRQEFEPATFDLERLCRNLVDDFKSRQNAHLILAIEGDVGAFVGDQQLIYSMIENLLSNALKFSPAEKPVRLEVVAEANDVLLRVSDQGVGIPLEEQEQVFEPFFRGSNIDETPGLGVGLAIVRDAVQLHQGTLHLESTEGKGTTFTVCLPLTSA